MPIYLIIKLLINNNIGIDTILIGIHFKLCFVVHRRSTSDNTVAQVTFFTISGMRALSSLHVKSFPSKDSANVHAQ